DYKELAKPLKPPPHGLEWEKLDDGTWELRTIRVRKAEPSREEQEQGGAKTEKGKEEGISITFTFSHTNFFFVVCIAVHT
ncbi:unnamed protein product, partial [Ectocarpus sp. 8 AP-2014]